jgi:hypothetical protein
MPQATRSDDHRTYRCYLRGPDGIRELSPAPVARPFPLGPAGPPSVLDGLEARNAAAQ